MSSRQNYSEHLVVCAVVLVLCFVVFVKMDVLVFKPEMTKHRSCELGAKEDGSHLPAGSLPANG